MDIPRKKHILKGNHPNVNGERGVLFKKFKEWLEDDEIINLVKNYVVGDGSYKVYLYKKKRKINNKETIKIDIKNGSIKRKNILVLKEEPIFDKNETNKRNNKKLETEFIQEAAKMAENGQANAQYILGKSYEMGLLGLDKKSAEQGHLLAKTKIDISV
ncbi:unnamed protein product [Rhizophagus irregularis]|uniref:Uncharacterized protein n=1 Tax=Rhizophagus irregularis TaxID=588596 RepID=A0A916EH43_9GLOM|nr:unnamed protein product [Rhizophagus irregularis]CAB5093345.1 unnamed protein product [Rhizophagus irregularis]CAB5382129.1 unnamed protein product [Rhizophagus irregularis]